MPDEEGTNGEATATAAADNNADTEETNKPDTNEEAIASNALAGTAEQATDANAASDDDDEDLFGDGSDEEQETPTPTSQPTAQTETSRDLEKPIPLKTNGQGTSETPEPSKAPTVPSNQARSIETPIPRATPEPSKAPTVPSNQARSIETPIPRAAPKNFNMGAAPNRFGLPAGVNIPKSVQPKLLQGKLLETLKTLPLNLINDALTEFDDAVQIKGNAIRNHGAYLYGVVKRYIHVQERTNAGEEAGMGSALTPAVNLRLQKLVNDQFCTPAEMNEKVKMKIRMLSEKDALAAIDELASVERRQIRNFGSYFMGILNRYMRGEKQMDPKKRQRQDSYDNRGGKRAVMDGQNESFRRDRSRFDQGRSPPSMRSQQQHYAPQPPLGQQSYPPPQMGGMLGGPPPPPPPPPNHRQMNSSFSRHVPPQTMSTGPPQNQMNQPPGAFVQQQPGGLPPSIYGPASQQQYNNGVVQPPQFSGGPQMGGNHPPPPPPTRNLQMYGNNGNQNNNNSRALPFQSPPSQSYVKHAPPQNNRFSQPQQQGAYQPQLQQQQQQQPYQQTAPPVIDILGIADMAASAVQQLQNQNSLHPSALQSSQPPQQQSMYSAPPPMSHPSLGFSSQQQSYPGAPTGMAPRNNNNNRAPRKRNHNTATMQELPIQVQFLIQNLQMTGQVEGPLDEGILGMVKDLPEGQAMQALQKFGSIDKNTMRNKTAYLAGVLRRELEGIARR
eukprot:scaffold4031_cov135-Cylindrotheca_fusiformis.AAC.5